MKNPFYLKPLPLSVPFCNREKETRDLVRYAENFTDIVLSSPRRYGKTSLVKRVQSIIREKGFLAIYIDYFGISSVEEFAAKFAIAIYAVVYKQKSTFEKAVRLFTSLRPVIRPDAETGLSVTVEVSRGKSGIQLFEETMAGFSEFLKSGRIKCNVVFDEFQEITELKDAKIIEGMLRSHIQNHENVSYFFVGSRRKILLDIFNDKKRPFYNSAINYTLPPLPADDTERYLVRLFKESGKNCPENIARQIRTLSDGYPYYIQKLSYFIFEVAENNVTETTLSEGLYWLLMEETPLFEIMLQALRPRQISLLSAIAKEPVTAPFAAEYISRQRLGSLGGVQAALKKLLEIDYIEKTSAGWKVSDPLFSLWLKRKETMES